MVKTKSFDIGVYCIKRRGYNCGREVSMDEKDPPQRRVPEKPQPNISVSNSPEDHALKLPEQPLESVRSSEEETSEREVKTSKFRL
jgi:hypothetical protein